MLNCTVDIDVKCLLVSLQTLPVIVFALALDDIQGKEVASIHLRKILLFGPFLFLNP